MIQSQREKAAKISHLIEVAKSKVKKYKANVRYKRALAYWEGRKDTLKYVKWMIERDLI